MNASFHDDFRAAQAFFPRGLSQPPGSFCFAMDSLLLASFVRGDHASRAMDLGCGCGVVSLGMACRFPHLTWTCVEVQGELARAARENVERLGFSKNFRIVHGDVRTLAEACPDEHGVHDIVLANPPFRSARKGRVSRSVMRYKALFEEPDTLDAFCAAAAWALKPGGSLGLLYPMHKINEVFTCSARNALTPHRVLPIQTRAGEKKELALISAQKSFSGAPVPDIARDAPLVVWQGQGERSMLTPEVLEFCPFLSPG